MTCSGTPLTSVSVATYFVSVFVDYGPVALAFGNLGLVAGFFLLQVVVVAIVHTGIVRYGEEKVHTFGTSAAIAASRKGGVDHDSSSATSSDASSLSEKLFGTAWIDASAKMRAPSLSILLLYFMLPGTVYGATVCLSSASGALQNIPAWAIAFAIVVSLLATLVTVLRTVVLPRSSYTNYTLPHPTGTAVEKALRLLPTTYWSPRLLVKSFGALMSSRCRRYCFLSFADVVLTCLLALSIGLGVDTKGASCAYAPIIIAALYLLYAAVLVALRPHRLFSDMVLAPVSSALFGAMCVCKYVGSSISVLETVVQITQMLLRLLALFREWEWRELVPEPAAHADAARGNLNDMKEEEEMDDISLGECEMEPSPPEHEDDVAFWDGDGAPIAPRSDEDEDLPPPPPPPLMPLRPPSDINNNEKASRKNKRFARTAKKRANLLLPTQVPMQPIVVAQKRSLNPPNNGLLMTTTMMREEDDVGAMMTHDINLLLPEAFCDGSVPQTCTSLFFNET